LLVILNGASKSYNVYDSLRPMPRLHSLQARLQFLFSNWQIRLLCQW